MSLQTLLVDFPNFSARKVRRLANQLATLQRAGKEFAMHDEVGILKGVESDLMEYNLQQARMEAQLNDDVREAAPAEKPKHDTISEERICVTPHTAAMKAINEMLEWMRVNTDVNMKKDELDALVNRCRGLVNGQSFYTDRTVIQARLSPQDSLPLETEEERLARGSLT